MRAATPSMSGNDANSATATLMAPSVAGIGSGNGSFVCPGGKTIGAWLDPCVPATADVLEDESGNISSAAASTRAINDIGYLRKIRERLLVGFREVKNDDRMNRMTVINDGNGNGISGNFETNCEVFFENLVVRLPFVGERDNSEDN
jgi:hypothetical protein